MNWFLGDFSGVQVISRAFRGYHKGKRLSEVLIRSCRNRTPTGTFHGVSGGFRTLLKVFGEL